MNADTLKPNPAISDETDLRDMLGVFRDEWRWIAGFWIVAALVSFLYGLSSTPVYRTNSLIHVEDNAGGLSGLGETNSVSSRKMHSETEIKIIRSRSVLGAAIKEQGLLIEAQPVYFPFVGATVARRHGQNQGPADAWFGLDSFAWGGERIQIDRLDIPPALLDQSLTLVAGGDGNFTLSFNDEPIVEGRVATAAQRQGVSIFISELEARPGTQFRVIRHDLFTALQKLGIALSVVEKRKLTGILELTLDGSSPQQVADTLNSITSNYLRQNVDRIAETASRTLEFLDGQLPELKIQLDAAESALNQFRVDEGSVNLSLEARGLLKQVTHAEGQLSLLSLRHAELTQSYTSEHSVIVAIQDQIAGLTINRSEIESQIRQLPEAQKASLRLMRDAQVVDELYTLLRTRAQELRVLRSGTVGNVRIIDRAFVPGGPIIPKRKLLLVMGSGLGVMLGLLFVFLREAMNPVIRDPEELKKAGGLPVYAIVPHSDREKRLNSRLGEKSETGQLLFGVKPDDIAIESLRSLRTSLEFLLLDTTPRIVTVGGPAPDAGKSFVTANLAALFLQTGKKTLLIDADLRKGHLHKLFSVPRSPGLAEIIGSRNTIDDAICRVVEEGLDFIGTGEIPTNPAELIASSQFEKLLAELGVRYDIVLIDAPPILGAAESVSLARLSTINLLVVRSERQTSREIGLSLDKLRQAGAKPNGFVLNDLQMSSRNSHAKYHYYQYSE